MGENDIEDDTWEALASRADDKLYVDKTIAHNAWKEQGITDVDSRTV